MKPTLLGLIAVFPFWSSVATSRKPTSTQTLTTTIEANEVTAQAQLDVEKARVEVQSEAANTCVDDEKK